MRIKFYFFCLQLICINYCKSQELPISQFDVNHLLINPGQTGERLSENKGIQLNANYFNQSANYTSGKGSYNSSSISFDLPLTNKFSIGQYILNEQSVESSFNNLNVALSGSYRLISANSDEEDKQNLSIGLQIGLINKSFNTENFLYENQYSPTSENGFNKNIPSGEYLTKQSYLKLNANVGIYYRKKFSNEKLTFYGGASIYHITKNDPVFFIPLRMNANLGFVFKKTESLSFIPQVFLINQIKSYQYSIGTLMLTKLNKNAVHVYESILGFSWRSNNAFILNLGLKTKGTTVKISYSSPLSYLRTFSEKGMEISFIHSFPSRHHK